MKELLLYCESLESSPLLFNFRLKFRDHLDQNDPAVLNGYLSLSPWAKKAPSTDNENSAAHSE